jgi:LacI family transcriptional regulator, galactose operon repressor
MKARKVVNKQITMKDIVEEVGHSRRTVSSVLNGKAAERGISVKTAEKILDYVKKRGYVQSRSALMLRGVSRKSIGVLYAGSLYSSKIEAYNEFIHKIRVLHPEDSMEIYVDVENNISEGIKELVSRGVEKLVCFYNFTTKSNDYTPFIVQTKFLKKVIIYDYNFIEKDDPWEKKLIDSGVSLIGFCRDAADLLISNTLLKNGHKNIILPLNYKSTRHPVFFEKAGLKCHYCAGCKPLAATGSRNVEELALSVKKIVEQNIAKAIYIHSDTIAAEAIMLFLELGLRVPEDISVIGFANRLISRCNIIPISTVDFPQEAMLNRVHDILEGRNLDLKHEFNPSLIIRKSFGKYEKFY